MEFQEQELVTSLSYPDQAEVLIVQQGTPITPVRMSITSIRQGTSHTVLQDIGDNAHDEIDTAIDNSEEHIADDGIHVTSGEKESIALIDGHVEDTDLHVEGIVQRTARGFFVRHAGMAWNSSTKTLSWTSLTILWPIDNMRWNVGDTSVYMPSTYDYAYIDPADVTRPIVASMSSPYEGGSWADKHDCFCFAIRLSSVVMVYPDLTFTI